MHEEDLYRLVCEYSSKEDVLSKEGLKLLSAECLAQKLGIPRNVISAALNKLYGTGALIKINTRPVYYLDRTLLESRFNVTIAQNLFFSIEQFDKILKQNESEKDIFSEIIGFDRSLKFQIKQCKAAAYYPGIGLPVLICGATGTGKSLLAKYMHAFCVQKKLIDSAAPFVTFNCADYADNPELLTGILFGYVKGAFTGADKDHVGLLEKANNGVLFLDEAHRLSGNGQEKLFMFMDQGVFSRLGEGSGERKSKVRLVFATTEEPKNAFLETFLRRIPVTITMPSLEERGHEEVMQIICGLLRNESVTFGRELSVSQDFVKILLSCKFRGNIGELTNIIKYACAEAYHYFCEQDDKTAIYVRSCYLPDKLLKQAAVSQQSAKLLSGFTLERIKISPHFRYENIRRLIEKQHNSQAVQNAYYNVFNSFLAGLNLNQTPKQIMASMENALDGYIDILSEESKDYVSNIQYSVFKTSVDNILDYMIHTDNILLTAGLRGLLVSHFYRKLNYMNMDSILPAKLADDIKMFFFQQYPQVYGKCSDIFRYFGTSLDVPLKNNDFVILALCLYESANKTKVYHTKALLLARGYSTATSIASVVNRLLEARIFEPFDMPLDLGIEEISRRINMYLKNSNDQQDIIIMTDLNRLQSFDRYIDSGYEGNIAVVNSITTQLALDIGNCILGEMPLVDMLKSSVDKNSTDYLLLRYQPPVRQQAIVTTCFTGMGTAEKLADLL
ncbi:MAG: sigma 54-interacting transcriptional regulator, partial [Bacillota bacterium]|nr:sigma 54-interacting transcriptional regulator [Bacillota bacterium]